MAKWLALYVNKTGKPAATMITPKADGDFPFGVDEFECGLADYDGEPVMFVEMPDEFRPMIVDNETDSEIALQFVDL